MARLLDQPFEPELPQRQRQRQRKRNRVSAGADSPAAASVIQETAQLATLPLPEKHLAGRRA